MCINKYRHRARSWFPAVAVACCVAGFGAYAGAEDLVERGRDRYINDCGGCHGADARGSGPVAVALKIPPSDLTRLSKDNSGEFPEDYVRRVVDGRTLPPAAHGETSMPVWGEHYRRALPGYSEAVVKEKIDALVAYLRSIQSE